MDATLPILFIGLIVIHGSSAQGDLATDSSSVVVETTVHSTVSPTHYVTASYTSQYSAITSLSSIPPSFYVSTSPPNTQHSSPTQAFSISTISPESPTSSSTQTSTSSSASPSSPSESISTFYPKSSTSPIVPSKSSKPHPASSVGPQKAMSLLTLGQYFVVIVKCGEECKSLKKRLWAAGVFAVFFGVASLVFMFLLFRQCRISRDFNDPALSRLI